MKMNINEEHICNSCGHHIVIVGCDCCAKCNAKWSVCDGAFTCQDYTQKKEIDDEKKKLC